MRMRSDVLTILRKLDDFNAVHLPGDFPPFCPHCEKYATNRKRGQVGDKSFHASDCPVIVAGNVLRDLGEIRP